VLTGVETHSGLMSPLSTDHDHTLELNVSQTTDWHRPRGNWNVPESRLFTSEKAGIRLALISVLAPMLCNDKTTAVAIT
jgi:hypothetical protein